MTATGSTRAAGVKPRLLTEPTTQPTLDPVGPQVPLPRAPPRQPVEGTPRRARGPSRGLRGQARSRQAVPSYTAEVVPFCSAIDKGRGLPGQGPRRPADVLRLPRRALEACTHDQPHREHVRHGSSAHLPDQGLPVAQDGDGHGLQTMPVRSEKMEKTRWIEPSRRDHSRRQIRRWENARIAPPHDQPIHNF